MKLYLSIMIGGTTIFAILTALFGYSITGYDWWFNASMSILATLAVLGIDIIFAVLVSKIPEKNFSPDKKFFWEAKWERKFYEAMGIRKWKDVIPELGKALEKFDKRHVADKSDPKYLYKFLCIMGRGEIMHFVCIFVGFLAIFCFPLSWWWIFPLPAIIVNMFLHTLPCWVQRYNRSKLLKAYERALKNSKPDESLVK